MIDSSMDDDGIHFVFSTARTIELQVKVYYNVSANWRLPSGGARPQTVMNSIIRFSKMSLS